MQKVYRDGIGLNDKISVEIEAGLIIAAVTAYATAEFSSDPLSMLLLKCQETIIDPVYWNEQQAAHQQAHDQASAMGQQFMHQILQQNNDPRIEGEE